MNAWLAAGVIFSAFVITAAGIPIFRRWSIGRGLLDKPNERSSHTVPTPRGGGLVIAAVVLISYAAASTFGGYAISYGFVVGGVLIVAISWLDDLISVPVPIRLIVQAISSAGVLIENGRIRSLSEIDATTAAMTILAFVWIIWLINAYNFMDGIDGIAGIQATIGGIGWSMIGISIGSPNIVIIGGTTASAAIAFLIYNWQPAKIFMGDAGSAFLGFAFAVLPFLVAGSSQNTNIDPKYAGVLFVWFFVFDSIFTFIRRAIRLEALWRAHRSHLYQRLVITGLSHATVSLIYGGFAAVVVLTFAAAERAGISQSITFGVASAISVLLVAMCFLREKAVKDGRSDK